MGNYPENVFKPYRLNSSQLEQLSYIPGQFIFTEDTHKIYIDTTDKKDGRLMVSADAITEVKRDNNKNIITFTTADKETEYTITILADDKINKSSENPVQNKPVATKFESVDSLIQSLSNNKVDKTITINTHPLNDNIVLTKDDIGLDEVENKSSTTIRSEITKQNAVDALGYIPVESVTGIGSISADLKNESEIEISIADASLSQPGVVQLTDAIDSSSTTTAATPHSVKVAYDLANSAKEIANSKISSVSLNTGSTNGTIKLNVNGATGSDIPVKGLGTAAYTNSTEYAISTTGDGVANSAKVSEKLGTVNQGNASTPIYLEGGVPKAINVLSIAHGGTGAATEDAARSNLKVYSKTEIDKTINDLQKDVNEKHQAQEVKIQRAIDFLDSTNNKDEVIDTLQEIIDFIGSEDAETAKELLDKIHKKVEVVKVNGTAVSPADSNGVRTVDIAVPTGALASKNLVEESDLHSTLKSKIDSKLNTVTYEQHISATDAKFSSIENQFSNVSNALTALSGEDELINAELDRINTVIGTPGSDGSIWDVLDNKANKTDIPETYAGSSIAGGAATSALKLDSAQSIALSGDVTGSASFDGSKGITISVTVKDDSHNHVTGNIDGLDNTLSGIDTKLNASIKGLSASGRTVTYTKTDGTTGSITTQDTTYSKATSSKDGLMSSTDKAKVDAMPQVVFCTQAEYASYGDAVKTDGKIYFIR